MKRSVQTFFGILVGITLLIGGSRQVAAQSIAMPKTAYINPGERLYYDAEFKWGLISPSAGSAEIGVRRVSGGGKMEYHYSISLRTSSFVDKFYYLRDTLISVISPDLRFLRNEKRMSERHKYSLRLTTVKYNGNTPTSFYLWRRKEARIMDDKTIGLAGKENITDLPGAIVILRSLDYSNLRIGASLRLYVIDNDLVVPAVIRYAGQETLKIDRKHIYRTHKFVIDINEQTFNKKNESMTVWVNDDARHVPVRIKSDLKYGAGMVTLRRATGI